MSLFGDLKAKAGLSVADETLFTSSEWFCRFKRPANLHQTSISGEGASTDKVAAEKFPKALQEINAKEGCSPQQLLNVDETGLFMGKKCHKKRTSAVKINMPGFKASKDRLTLLLGGNMSGDFELKLVLVYCAQNPRALKKVTKSFLPVVWMANKKA